MSVIFKTRSPVEAQLLVTRLHDEGIPAVFVNEGSYIVGLSDADGLARVSVPDETAERARQIFEGRDEPVSLPEDPEFEDETPPPRIPPLEWSFMSGPAFRTAVVFAIIAVAAGTVIAIAEVLMLLAQHHSVGERLFGD